MKSAAVWRFTPPVGTIGICGRGPFSALQSLLLYVNFYARAPNVLAARRSLRSNSVTAANSALSLLHCCSLLGGLVLAISIEIEFGVKVVDVEHVRIWTFVKAALGNAALPRQFRVLGVVCPRVCLIQSFQLCSSTSPF